MINPLNKAQPIVEDNGIMDIRFRNWTDNVSRLAIIEGSGSPEGVVEALTTQLYMDTTGISGSILYIKRDDNINGDRTQGWILV